MQTWRLAFIGLVVPCMAIGAPLTVTLNPTGLGQVKLGMYLNAVAKALGNPDLYEISGQLDGNHCYSIQSKLRDRSTGMTFVGLRNPDIQRIDITYTDKEIRASPQDHYVADTVNTKEGVKLGDQLAKVQRLYKKSSIYEPPRRIVAGYYVVAVRGSNAGYGFLLEGNTVVELRAGRLDALGMSGKCL
jgi:hypothetical protein